MVGSPEAGVQTQLNLLGPQDYDMWLARSDMYPRGWWWYRSMGPSHRKAYDTLVSSVPLGVSNEKKEAVLLGLVAGLAVVAVWGLALYYGSKKGQ